MKQYNSKEIISFWLAFIASVIAVTALIIPPRGRAREKIYNPFPQLGGWE